MNNIWKKYPEQKPLATKGYHTNILIKLKRGDRIESYSIPRPTIDKENEYLKNYCDLWCYESDLIASIDTPTFSIIELKDRERMGLLSCKAYIARINSELIKEIDSLPKQCSAYRPAEAADLIYKMWDLLEKCKTALSGKE